MLLAAVIAAATLATHPAGAQAGNSGIEMRTVRFWLGEVQKTSVMATIDVPYMLATPVGSGPTAYIAYQVRVTVLDDKGNILDDEKWLRHAPAAMRAQNATGMEPINFGVVAGSYWLRAQVTDSATGKVVSDSIKFDGYRSSPGVSDLLLASRMRQTPSGDTTTEAGELARGDFRFITSPSLHIDLTQPTMGFLMEAYSPDAVEATLALKVAMADGTDIVPLLPKTQKLPAGGGIIASQFSLDGLPAGQYLLKATLAMKGQTVERQAPFTVNVEQVALSNALAQTAADKGIDQVYFNSLPEDSLDLYAQVLELVPGVTARERAPYKADELSLSAKRAFLTEFWARRDEVKSTPENETRITFYAKIGYANAHFGARFLPGWRSAMGKVFAKYGVPDDSLSSRMEGRGIPYTVWRMSHGKDRWFIFGDRSNTGAFVLLRSNEPSEGGTLGWRTMVTPEATYKIAEWLALPRNYFDNEQ